MPADTPVVPTRLNPDLSIELQLEVNFFLKWGYLVVENALTDEQVRILRVTLDETFEIGSIRSLPTTVGAGRPIQFFNRQSAGHGADESNLGQLCTIAQRYRTRNPSKSAGSELAPRWSMANGPR